MSQPLDRIAPDLKQRIVARSKQSLTAVRDSVFPPRCVACGALVETDAGICADCWKDTPFQLGGGCTMCGAPLPGDTGHDQCDDCLQSSRPWQAGRAALLYAGQTPKMVMAFKHGDRHDIAGPAARWMWQSCCDIATPDMVVVPVPLHWRRMMKRRFNQSALLAQKMARIGKMRCIPDALQRVHHTVMTRGQTADERRATMDKAIRVTPRFRDKLAQKPVLLVDDVMTTGATLTACAMACQAAGTGPISVVVLARVAKPA